MLQAGHEGINTVADRTYEVARWFESCERRVNTHSVMLCLTTNGNMGAGKKTNQVLHAAFERLVCAQSQHSRQAIDINDE